MFKNYPVVLRVDRYILNYSSEVKLFIFSKYNNIIEMKKGIDYLMLSIK